MIQRFYCKFCKKEFEINQEDEYWNYNCPECNTISPKANWIPPIIKGLPNTKL